MIRADLKEVSVSDDIFVDNWQIVSSIPFNVPIHLTIGVQGRDGGDIFVSSLCNLRWLESEVRRLGVVIEGKTFIVGECTLQEVEEIIKEKVNRIVVSDWSAVVARAKEFADWEFEK